MDNGWLHEFLRLSKFFLARTAIYIYMGSGISPPAFCDISKSHELRQFRVKGLGYMSFFWWAPFWLSLLPKGTSSAGPH